MTPLPKADPELVSYVTDAYSGLTLTDDSWLGLLQQALDGYAKEDDVPSDVAELVTRLQERLVELVG